MINTSGKIIKGKRAPLIILAELKRAIYNLVLLLSDVSFLFSLLLPLLFFFAFSLRSTLNLKHHIAAVKYTGINPERPVKTNSKSLRPSEKFHYFRRVTCRVFLIKECWMNDPTELWMTTIFAGLIVYRLKVSYVFSRSVFFFLDRKWWLMRSDSAENITGDYLRKYLRFLEFFWMFYS